MKDAAARFPEKAERAIDAAERLLEAGHAEMPREVRRHLGTLD